MVPTVVHVSIHPAERSCSYEYRNECTCCISGGCTVKSPDYSTLFMKTVAVCSPPSLNSLVDAHGEAPCAAGSKIRFVVNGPVASTRGDRACASEDGDGSPLSLYRHASGQITFTDEEGHCTPDGSPVSKLSIRVSITSSEQVPTMRLQPIVSTGRRH